MTLRIKVLLRSAFFLIPLLCSHIANAQVSPFTRGVNLSQWFQASGAMQIQFKRYTRTDLEDIRSLGCDVIRLPINLHAMTSGAPEYRIDTLLYHYLDQVIDWAEDLGLYIILDNHSFDPSGSTQPAIENVLIPVWKQVADHMKDRSGFVLYEILNEPQGIDDATWGAIQGRVIDSIRTIDTTHTLIVGPASWNSYHNLAYLPAYADTNLIYTFHFYDPFIFTHQGATWTAPSLSPLNGVPFPYDGSRMPTLPSSLVGTWIENNYAGYSSEGTTAKVRQLLDIAVQFKTLTNAPLLCGEFGVYIPNSPRADRVIWYEAVRSYLEENGIAWTTWDYRGGFGVFAPGSDEMFNSDLNIPLIDALGLSAPPQVEPTIPPDSTDVGLYDDQLGPNILSSYNFASGSINDQSLDGPYQGTRCIAWSDGDQYSHVGFDFRPNKDLSYLVSEGYVLSMYAKTATSGLMLDVRFVDTKTGDPNDHPWRMRSTLDQFSIPGDDQWHHIVIPLSAFEEHGSWDNAWFEPQGLFDWTAVDRFEVVAEHHDLKGKTIWLDQISLLQSSVSGLADRASPAGTYVLEQNFPNPFNPSTTIRFFLPTSAHVMLRVYDLLGREVRQIVAGDMSPGDHHAEFQTHDLPSGMYVYTLETPIRRASKRMVIVR